MFGRGLSLLGFVLRKFSIFDCVCHCVECEDCSKLMLNISSTYSDVRGGSVFAVIRALMTGPDASEADTRMNADEAAFIYTEYRFYKCTKGGV